MAHPLCDATRATLTSRADVAKNADKIGQRVKRLTKKLAEEFREAKLGLRPSPRMEGKDEIEYETGLDPATGEIKGPDIDINEVASSSFVEREVCRRLSVFLCLSLSLLSGFLYRCRCSASSLHESGC